MKTHAERLEAVRRKVIGANPSLKVRLERFDDGDTDAPSIIRLADVLLTVDQSDLTEEKVKELMGVERFETVYMVGKIVKLWNLRADDLSLQSEETVAFLYNLLK